MKYWVDVDEDNNIFYVDDREMELRGISFLDFKREILDGKVWHESEFLIDCGDSDYDISLVSILENDNINEVYVRRSMFMVNHVSDSGLELCMHMGDDSWRCTDFMYNLKDLFVYTLDRHLTGIWTSHGVYHFLCSVYNIEAIYQYNGYYAVKIMKGTVILDGGSSNGAGWYYKNGVSKKEAMREALFECSM